MDLTLALARLMHVLIPIYWLGGDLGTFLCGRAVRNEALSPPARLAALRLLLDCDMGPRTALILTLPTGMTLAWMKHWLALPGFAIAAAWALGLAWLGLAWAIHLRHGPAANGLKAIDIRVRYVLLAGLVAVALAGLFGILAIPLFICLKLLLLAGAMALGVLVRRQLVPLFPAIAALRQHGASPATDAAIRGVLLRTTRSVLGIWAVILLAAFIGLATPL